MSTARETFNAFIVFLLVAMGSQAEAEVAEGREPASSTRARPITIPAQEEPPSETLFGDWGGFKARLKDTGVDLGVYYKNTTMSILSGGTKSSTAVLGNLDLTADLNVGRWTGIDGLSLFLYGLGNHGGKPSKYVLNEMGVDNIEAPSTFKLYEAYLKKDLDDRFVVLIGLRDLNADYYVTESSMVFINPTFGISQSLAQTGPNGPSIFPTTALAVNLKYQSPSHFYFQGGVFDAIAGDPNHRYGTQIAHKPGNGHLIISEAGWSGSDKDPSKTSVGAWTYTEPEDPEDPNKEPVHNYGYYLLLDHKIIEPLAGFFRMGFAAPTVNSTKTGIETGLNYKGLIKSRADDVAGIALSRVTFTDDYRRVNDTLEDETVFEILYRFSLPRGILLQPDIQYVIHPGGTRGAEDVTVGALRVEVDF